MRQNRVQFQPSLTFGGSGMTAFLSSLLIALLFLVVLILSHTTGVPAWLAHPGARVHVSDWVLGAGCVLSAIAAFSRLPARRRRRLPTASIRSFQCLQSKGDFDGDVVAMRLAVMIEQEAGTKRKALELITSTPAPSIDLKLGAAGSISVPVAWLKGAWRWLRAREVIQAEGIICDQTKPGSILMSIAGQQYRTPIAEDSVGIERALAWMARILLQSLAPMRLARRYRTEMNYPAAVQVYNAHLQQRGRVAQIELELAGVELESGRYDRAAARLQGLERQKLTEAQKCEVCRLMGMIHLQRGEYEDCEKRIRAGLAIAEERVPGAGHRHGRRRKPVVLTSPKAAFFQLRATLASARDDLETAEKQWLAVVDAIKEELQKHIQSPLGPEIRGWSQLEDEVGAALQTADLFPLVYNLCDAWLNRALCLERLQRTGGEGSELDDNFGSAISALRPLRLLNEPYAEIVGARCHRAYAASLERCQLTDRAKMFLDTALRLGDAAASAIVAESPYHLSEPAIPYWLAWIHLGRVDCLQRKIRLTGGDGAEKQILESEKQKAITDSSGNLNVLSMYPDWFCEAQAAYGKAALARCREMWRPQCSVWRWPRPTRTTTSVCIRMWRSG